MSLIVTGLASLLLAGAQGATSGVEPGSYPSITPVNIHVWAAKIQADYPERAKRLRQEGTVRVHLTIAPSGRATACEVVESSGHDLLDEAACKGYMRHGRFKPAVDADGKPVEAVFETEMTYRDPAR